MLNRGRQPTVDQMRASGMTDDEIAEIVDLKEEKTRVAEDREREIQELEEIQFLEKQAQ